MGVSSTYIANVSGCLSPEFSRKLFGAKQWEQEGIQSSANHPLADSPRFIVNKFEHVQGGGRGGGR